MGEWRVTEITPVSGVVDTAALANQGLQVGARITDPALLAALSKGGDLSIGFWGGRLQVRRTRWQRVRHAISRVLYRLANWIEADRDIWEDDI